MKQEDLKNLKIEDLEEVTDGHYVFGMKVILISDLVRFSKTVFAIVKDNDHGIITDNDYYSSKIFKAYKIPKPQKRERTVVEKVKYLQKIESGLKDDEILAAKYITDKMWNIGRNLYDVILKGNDYEFAIYKSEDDIEIIEIPEIEV